MFCTVVVVKAVPSQQQQRNAAQLGRKKNKINCKNELKAGLAVQNKTAVFGMFFIDILIMWKS